ncbi:hypothetical protein HLG76_14130 [Salinivibrio sp. EAGSL]|uniref:hypothetical protein n=1 Tax=Salinivibrio sp. EAGSL TaxID=2738468 RepID=UPI00158B06E2|nr:hypothetical protein [Salinivibrio sp. EAGSL]NUY57659.1 hypothetical protein [Salinivibrio sp. EAGSL]
MMPEFFYDLPNVFFVFIFILVMTATKKIPIWLSIILILTSLFPFLLNDVLFPTSYMPDQFKYFSVVRSLRELDIPEEYYSSTVKTAGWILAFIPLPVVESPTSLGFFNRFLYCFLIVWLYHKKKIRGIPLVFLALYPSAVLYTSLALRDTLILFLMVISIIAIVDDRKKVLLMAMVPLFFLKFQNFFIIALFYPFYLILTRETLLYKSRKLLFPVILFSLAGMASFIQNVISLVDFYRRAMFVEDGGDIAMYTSLVGISDFFKLAITSAPHFLMKPFFWEVESNLQLLQSLENIFMAMFLFLLFSSSFSIDKKISFKWLCFLLGALSIYGIVVFNFGTAARYRFPFLIATVIGLTYDIYINHSVFLLRRVKVRVNSVT